MAATNPMVAMWFMIMVKGLVLLRWWPERADFKDEGLITRNRILVEKRRYMVR